MTKMTAHQKVIVELRKIIKQVNVHSISLAQNIGLTVSQLNLLQELDNGNKMSMPELSKRCLISKQTSTEILHKLEKKSLVSRSRSNDDKRCCRKSANRCLKNLHSCFRTYLLMSSTRLKTGNKTCFYQICREFLQCSKQAISTRHLF